MNKHNITFLLVLPFLQFASLNAQAAQQAILVIPEALDIVSVDNVKVSRSLFAGGDATLRLPPGQHKVVVEYDIIFDINYDDHERIVSEPFQIAFSAAAGNQYYIKMPSFNDVDKAKAYAKKPVVEVVDSSSNQSIAAEITYREFDGTFSKQNTRPSITIESSQARVTPEMFRLPAASTATSPKTDPAPTSHMPLKMLEYWWEQANEQQRKQFIESR